MSKYLLLLRVRRNPRNSLVNRVEPLKKEFKTFARGEFSYSLILYVEAKLARVDNVTVGRNVRGEENGMSTLV